jgi:hypothetical protein
MASAIKIADALREDMADAIIALLGSGALIDIYTGTKPAGPGTAITSQTKLGTLTCSATFGTYSAGVLTANTITQDSAADATGTAAWYRLKTSGGTALIDGEIGTSGSDLNLNTLSIVTGGPISISSFTYTMPGG